MKLSIVVPCYNEADNLSALLRRFQVALAGRPDIELILVNNGSIDHSSAVFQSALQNPAYRFARLVSVPVNQGYGHGIVAGLRAARGEFLAWTHADLQTDPRDVVIGLETLLRQEEPQNCFLRGRRIGRSWLDAGFTFGMGVIASLLLRTPLQDINAQPKLFHRSLFARMVDPPKDFSLDLYVLYLARQLRLQVLEQPVRFAERLHGQAKGGGTLLGKYRLTKRTLGYLFRLSRALRRQQLEALLSKGGRQHLPLPQSRNAA